MMSATTNSSVPVNFTTNQPLAFVHLIVVTGIHIDLKGKIAQEMCDCSVPFRIACFEKVSNIL